MTRIYTSREGSVRRSLAEFIVESCSAGDLKEGDIGTGRLVGEYVKMLRERATSSR